MKLSIDTSWFRFLSDLPADEIKKITRLIWDYSNGNADANSDAGAWEVMKTIIDKKIESNARRAEQNRINGAKNTGRKNKEISQLEPVVSKMENTETPANENKTEPVVNPFVELTDDPEIIEALTDANSGLSVFLATGQGYDDSLTRAEREFADRDDVRAKCKWHKELMAASKQIKKFAKPTLEDWLDFCREKNLDIATMKSAYESYDVAGWYDSAGRPIRNWKQKILQVWAVKAHNQNRAQFTPKSKAEINTEKSYAAYAEFLKLTGN